VNIASATNRNINHITLVEREQMSFHLLQTAISSNFDLLKTSTLYLTSISGEVLWQEYLNKFPDGTNPILRKRTEHDCSCCRQFIKAVGNLVAIKDNKLISIWDIEVANPTYQTVANAMSMLVKSHEIANVFLYSEDQVGIDKNFEQTETGVTTWNHFYIKIPSKGQNRSLHYAVRKDIATKQSDVRTSVEVFTRSLNEIDGESISTVLDLIKQNSIYRGEEHKFVVDAFDKLSKQYKALPETERDNFVWSKSKDTPGSVLRIRSSVIGSLLNDLAEGKDLEDAVRSFESKVAPMNYKRPSALVTKSMVEAAKTKIAELNLTSALQRRYANLNDITINNILFVDRATRKILKGDIFDSIPTKSPATAKQLDKVEEITIEKFVQDILPKAESLEVFFENRAISNLVSLIAPQHKNSSKLIKWDNQFTWSYNGDVTDSIKERVKKAGGSVVGDLCCRLAWYNHDDLDFHMQEPGYEIYYATKYVSSPSGGRLDVDMNAGVGTTREPVENIFYKSKSSLKEGNYHLFVNQYSHRENSNIGFDVEIDYLGDITSYSYSQPMRANANVTVVKFKYSREKGIEITESLTPSHASKEIWNLKTQEFHKVNMLMMSPNYWDEQGSGNKHYFFMLENCRNDGSARGFYNEFLREDLTPHRKVIEIVGSKMNTEKSNEQLSGVGFSSTKRDNLLVRVKGSFTRTVRVIF
jgi:hypothetical protein